MNEPANNAITPGIIKRSEARMAVIKALYANATNYEKKSPASLALDILACYDEKIPEFDGVKLDSKFFTKLLEGIAETHEELEEIITPHLSKRWTLERMGPVLQSILLAATYELAYIPSIAYKTIINEYVTITHGFFDTKEVGFVNGILDKIAPTVREINE